jgi:hypothetical protein
VSFLFAALVASTAAGLATYWAARKGRRGSPEATLEAAKKAKAALNPPPPTTPDTLPLSLGDVVSAEGEERWLEGALVAREDGHARAALFFAREGLAERAVLAFAPPRRELFWLAPTDTLAPREPPGTLEVGRETYQRVERFPAAVERVGVGAPQVGEVVLWALYEGGGRKVALLLAGGLGQRVWTGTRVEDGEWDRMGQGA